MKKRNTLVLLAILIPFIIIACIIIGVIFNASKQVAKLLIGFIIAIVVLSFACKSILAFKSWFETFTSNIRNNKN